MQPSGAEVAQCGALADCNDFEAVKAGRDTQAPDQILMARRSLIAHNSCRCMATPHGGDAVSCFPYNACPHSTHLRIDALLDPPSCVSNGRVLKRNIYLAGSLIALPLAKKQPTWPVHCTCRACFSSPWSLRPALSVATAYMRPARYTRSPGRNCSDLQIL